MNSHPFPSLETTRLRLRCVAPADAAATSSMMTPEVSRWVASWPLPFTPEMAAVRIETMRRAAFEGDALPFAVVEKGGGALAGWITISRNAENQRRGSLGYWLGHSFQHRGFMKESDRGRSPAGQRGVFCHHAGLRHDAHDAAHGFQLGSEPRGNL